MLVTDEVDITNMSDETLDVRDISRGPITVSHQPPFFFMSISATDRVHEDDIDTFELELDPMGSLDLTL